MDTRTTSIVTALALLGSAAVATSFGSAADAAPPNQGPTLTPVTTESGVVPTTFPATTVPLDEAAEFDSPVDLAEVAPEPVPVTTLADVETKNGSTGRLVPIDEAESPAPIEIDPAFAPDPEYLAPCGNVPRNLEPIGWIRLVDMAGDGSANDKLSLRRDGSGAHADWWLHLELSDGTRSEAWINVFTGQTPAIDSIMDIDQVGSVDGHHPHPAADEALVRHGFNDTAQFLQVYGTDERGCIAAYTNEFASPSGVTLTHRDDYRAGFMCFPDVGQFWKHDAIRESNGETWTYAQYRMVRTGPTTTRFAHEGLAGNTWPTETLPYIGGEC